MLGPILISCSLCQTGFLRHYVRQNLVRIFDLSVHIPLGKRKVKAAVKAEAELDVEMEEPEVDEVESSRVGV